jgi:putative PEP-CTERM system TPR-repeat lipoprotein
MRTALATSRLAAGQSEAGIQDLESAVELDSGKYQADVLLALSRLNQKNYDKALEGLQGLERKQPNNPLTHNLQAAAYIGKQDYDRARKQLEHALALNPSYFPAAANLAQLDLKAQRPADAKQRFLTVLDRDKNHMQAMLALADLGLATGAPKEEVIGWLDRAKKAHPQSAQPHIAFARYYLKLGDAKRALLAAQDARNLSPDNADALGTLGLAQSAAGEKEHAITTYTRLAALQPRSAQGQFQLAQAQEAAGHRGAAVQALKKALELKPDYLDAQVALIGLQLNAGNKSEALALTQKMQKQSPKSPAGYALEGDVLMTEKKYASAATAYTRAYELGKTANLVIKIHGAQTLAGKPTQAEAILAQWLKANPNDLVARLYAGEVRLKAGQYKQAIEYYLSVLDKQPDHLIALNNLAWAYQHLKSPKALEYAERAYKLKPESGAIADTLGWVLVEQGNIARGLELLHKAVSLNPNNAETRYHLAVALAKSGDKSKARQELESLLTPEKEFPQREEAQALLKQL